jgi:hypothetical protein
MNIEQYASDIENMPDLSLYDLAKMYFAQSFNGFHVNDWKLDIIQIEMKSRGLNWLFDRSIEEACVIREVLDRKRDDY